MGPARVKTVQRQGAANPRTHFRVCNLCEAMCGLALELDGQDIVAIRGDNDDPFSQGHICPKATALQDIYHDPDRLKHPLRRVADGWQSIGWSDAFDEVAERLNTIRARHGDDAVAVYQGNPTVHNSGTMLTAPELWHKLHTRNRFSATSVDQLPHHFASYWMFGHQLLIPVPDIDRTEFFLVLGANPLVSNGSLMTAPGMRRRLRALRARGGKLVVVDPRRTETAAAADQHLFIRPATDVLFLLALIHTLFADGLVAPGRLVDFADGIDRIEALVADFAPERIAAITGIEAATIRSLASEFGRADSAVCYGRFGVSTQEFGGLSHWLINLINVLTGNLDRAGGAMFPRPAIDTVTRARAGSHGRWHSRVRGVPEFAGELPVATLAEEILTPGDGQVRAMVCSAGNPVLSTPNGAQLDTALAGLELMVSIDIYLNETSRHAHIILPPTTGLEVDHYDLAFHALAVRNTAKYSRALFAPAKGALHDWQIFRQLSRRIAARYRPQGLVSRLGRALLVRMTPQQLLDLGLRTGPYGVWGGRRLSRHGLSRRRLEQHPHGIDLGPLTPCLPARLFTSDQRLALAPEVIVGDLARVDAAFFTPATTPDSPFDLALIGRRTLRSNNSWMHNCERLVRGAPACTLRMHPVDAANRGVVDGQTVEVVSRVGSLDLPVQLTDTMMEGVVSLPHGWGHGRSGVKLQTAASVPGASVNDLTDDQRVDGLCGTAALNGVPVRVRPK